MIIDILYTKNTSEAIKTHSAFCSFAQSFLTEKVIYSARAAAVPSGSAV